MEKQLIISVSREYASSGHLIAEKLAERFSLPLYDKNLLHEIAEMKSVNANKLLKYDEIPRNKIFSRSVRNYNNSPEENIAQMQFEYLKKKARAGESFVIVGRCSESVLKEFDSLVSIFVLADMDSKIKKVVDTQNISEEEAKVVVVRQNKARKAYHNYYCTEKWGDSRNYDISINSSRLGVERTADILEEYIKERLK